MGKSKYQFRVKPLGRHVLLVRLNDGAKRLTFRDVLNDWSAGEQVNDGFTRLIAEAPFPALYWEMPPLTSNRLDREYECVLIDAPALGSLNTDVQTFREHFVADEEIVVFDNLGADAILVVPVPTPSDAQYTHLAKFCCTAPASLSRRFWQRIGEIALQNICNTPVWISTAGMGVGWLHARLDSRPKYYCHVPYRHWSEPTGDTDA